MSKLDREEQEILNSFEKGEWQSVKDQNRLKQLHSYAEATITKDKQITLRLSSLDLNAIQAKAIEEGISYQALISSIIHKYATGILIDRREKES
jgi:predicted DNA binding CopG/RHH family protein